MSAPVMAISLCYSDPAGGETIRQRRSLPLTIGSDPQRGLVLPSTSVAPHHATIEAAATGMVITDQQSLQGTILNGQRIMSAPLVIGDTLQIGPYHITIEAPEGTHESLVMLTWRDPADGVERRSLQAPPLRLGRAGDNDLVLADRQVSRHHALIEADAEGLVIIDLGSANGIYLDGQRCQRGRATEGSRLKIGPYELTIGLTASDQPRADTTTIVVVDQPGEHQSDEALPVSAGRQSADPVESQAQGGQSSGAVRGHDDWPPPLFEQPVVPMAALLRLGIPVGIVDYLAIGGGLGSFIWVDNLVIAGVRPEQVSAVGITPQPHDRYQRLCRNSQIPAHERLRSNSDSCPDNIWGWPGYAVREIWQALGSGQFGQALTIFGQIFGEPAFSETYTPRAGDVFRSIEREAARIGWSQIWRYGRVRAIRLTDDGRYVVAISGSTAEGARHSCLVARYLQIATGYPALRFLPDLQAYRAETGDFRSVVNAYEQHDHVYDHLERYGGLVLLRGRGIVASRLIQRLDEARRRNPKIGIIHLSRTPIGTGHRYGRARRRVVNAVEVQPFNWPKACWGGELRLRLERAAPEERKRLLSDWGGTTTADRGDWQTIIQRGLNEGWYQVVFGTVDRVRRTEQGRLGTIVHEQLATGAMVTHEYEADFIVDATGLDAEVTLDPLLRDLVHQYQLPLNLLKRIHVENDFEIAGLRNGPGRVYAAGAITLGGPFAAVDSFLGLQYAAQRSVDALVALGAPNLRYLDGLASLAQWLKWARGVAP